MRRRTSRRPRARTAVALILVLSAAPAAAQAGGGWDTPRALELVELARAARAVPADSGLLSYRARAEGHVYFYLDRPETQDRVLVKADQVALEVFWRFPDLTKQRIVGMRDEDVLPNRMRYHLDHLTVVQDEFADRIRLGDGDEVQDVPHPAAPGSDSIYAFRLSDSLTLRLPSEREPLRTYEVQFRPRDLDRPALVGSMFLDRASGAIVRLSFTFTPVSYVDPRLEQIRISLDNGLWEGRYWLPNEQRLEIRRQLPQFDVAVSSVIAGSFTITDYELNRPIPTGFFGGPTVIAVTPRQREAYPFRTGLMAGLQEQGLEPAPDLQRIEQTVKEIARQRLVSGLPRFRPFIPSVSSAVRYNRAEEVFFGAGAALRIGQRSRIHGSVGYATGPGHVHGALGGRFPVGESVVLTVRGYANERRDLGQAPGPAGALNTLSVLVGGHDFLDPYYATGGSIQAAYRIPDSDHTVGLDLRMEEHARAVVTASPGDATFRPVRSVAEERLVELSAVLQRELTRTPRFDHYRRLSATQGWRADGRSYSRIDLRAGLRWAPAGLMDMTLDLAAGDIGRGSPPAQRLHLLGGYGTLPGYPYRAYAGTGYVLASLALSRPLGTPLLRLRALASGGWTHLDSGDIPPVDWGVTETLNVRSSAGLGLGLFWDMLRLDAWRGLQGGEWQVLVSVNPMIRDVF